MNKIVFGLILGLFCAGPAFSDDIVEAGGSSLATAQAIVATGSDTIISGVFGDAVHMGSGTVTTTGGTRQQVSVGGGTSSNLFTVTAAPYLGTPEDATLRQYTDDTFTSEMFFDDDDGPGLYPELRTGESITDAAGIAHLEFGEFGDDAEISYGYDVLDVSNATRIDDWFEVSGLQPGSTFTVSMVTDGVSFGFSDAVLNLFDSDGTPIGGGDADNGVGNVYLEIHSVTVGSDGIVGFQVTQSGTHPGGTYNIELEGVVSGGGPVAVAGESLTVAPGIINSGGLPDLEDSDNVSLVLFRDTASTAAVTQFILTATSPTTTPTTFEFVLEGRCVSRPNVVQRVEFFDYVAGAFEIVDEQNAVRMPPDLSITVTPAGDLSRFVDPSTGEIQARVRYRADSPRASFSSRTDQAVWMIE